MVIKHYLWVKLVILFRKLNLDPIFPVAILTTFKGDK